MSTPSRSRALVPLAVLFALAGYDRFGTAAGPPIGVRLKYPEGPIFTTEPISLDPEAFDSRGQKIRDIRVWLSTSNPSVASIDEEAQVMCRSTGDAWIRAAAPPVRDSVPIRCRVIAEIRVTDLVKVLPGRTAPLPDAQVFTDLGSRTELAPVEVTLTDTTVARIEGGKVRGISGGTATLVWEAANVRAETVVSVAHEVVSEERVP